MCQLAAALCHKVFQNCSMPVSEQLEWAFWTYHATASYVHNGLYKPNKPELPAHESPPSLGSPN